MKTTIIQFFASVTSVFLMSALLLTGGMYAIGSDYGEAKAYDMDSQINTDGSIMENDDAPVAQTELQKKFSSMYEISEDGKTITVISQNFLNEFWQSNYEKEVGVLSYK